MNNVPIKGIIVTGHYAAGKGVVSAQIQQLLESHFPSLAIVHEKDRFFLNVAVLRDVNDQNAPRPGIEGLHSTIRDIGPPLVFDIKDGSLHLEAHTNMIQAINNTEGGILRIQEIACGPDIPSFGFRQNGAHLVSLLSDHGVKEDALIIEVFAPYRVRHERNLYRSDKVSEEIMAVAALDGGGVFEVRQHLGNNYYHLDNTGDHKLLDQVHLAFETFIRPNIETTLKLIEGNQNSMRWRK